MRLACYRNQEEHRSNSVEFLPRPGTVHVKFNDPLKKSNAPTFHDLYKKCSSTKKKNTDKIVKEDRDSSQHMKPIVPWILQLYCPMNFSQNHWHWWMLKAK